MISETVRRAAALSATATALVAGMIAAQPVTAAMASPGCGWKPANYSGDGAWIAYNNVNVRTGPSTSCSPKSPQVNAYQQVTIRCLDRNSDDGIGWYYVMIGQPTISVPPFIGWVRSDLVADPFPPAVDC